MMTAVHAVCVFEVFLECYTYALHRMRGVHPFNVADSSGLLQTNNIYSRLAYAAMIELARCLLLLLLLLLHWC
jgi:hypothetical protein